MDLDNITDIEILRDEVKKYKVKMLVDCKADNGDYIFKKGYYYDVLQDQACITVYFGNYCIDLTYGEALKYICNTWSKQ